MIIKHIKGCLKHWFCNLLTPWQDFLQKHLRLHVQKAKGPQKHKRLHTPAKTLFRPHLHKGPTAQMATKTLVLFNCDARAVSSKLCLCFPYRRHLWPRSVPTNQHQYSQYYILLPPTHNNLSLLWGSPTFTPLPPYSCMVWNQNCWCFLKQCKKICNINLFSKIAERIHPFLRRQAPWGVLQDRGGQTSGYWGVMLWGQVWVPATCRATQWPCDRMWGFVRRLSGRPSLQYTHLSQMYHKFSTDLMRFRHKGLKGNSIVLLKVNMTIWHWLGFQYICWW